MGVNALAQAIKEIVEKRIAREARAGSGIIQNGMFQCGAKSYPFKKAVDCNTSEGNKVWAQMSPEGFAVIVGA